MTADIAEAEPRGGTGHSACAPFVLPDLGRTGAGMMRSRPLWLCGDGALCRAGTPVVAFNVNLGHLGAGEFGHFAEERTLQVALVPQVAGRLVIADRGNGSLADLTGVYDWVPGQPIATYETADQGAAIAPPGAIFFAGNRTGWAVDSDAAILPGWNARARAWWGARIAPHNTLVSLGLCDATALTRGIAGNFAEFATLAGQAFHIAHHSEHPLVFCATILLEQLRRSDADRAEMARDLMARIAAAPVAPTPADIQFIGILLARLQASPLTERLACLCAGGVVTLAPPRFALLSLLSEPVVLLRHRTLGYHIHIFAHDIRAAGTATRAMIKQTFAPVSRTIAEIADSYRDLADEAKRQSRTRLIVMNRNSAVRGDAIVPYQGLGADVETRLSHVFSNSLNVMLDDLAAEGLLYVIDVDLRATQLGTRDQLPDGVHFSRLLEQALRKDLVHTLERHGALGAEPPGRSLIA